MTSTSVSSDVSEVVRASLKTDEQSLRSIRASVAEQLDLEPSAVTSPVARALTKLVAEGTVERPRRGFYRSVADEVDDVDETIETETETVEAIVPSARTESEQQVVEPEAPALEAETTVTEVEEVVEASPAAPEQIARPLAANRLTFRPKFVRSAQSSTAPSNQTVAPMTSSFIDSGAATPAKAQVEKPVEQPDFVPAPAESVERITTAPAQAEPVIQPEPATEVEPTLQDESTIKTKETSGLESVSLEEVADEVSETEELVEEEAKVKKPGLLSRLHDRIRARRERKWTPQGSMGTQGMAMIILWFVLAGATLFIVNNTYAIAAAVALVPAVWLFSKYLKHNAAKSKARAKARAQAQAAQVVQAQNQAAQNQHVTV